MTKTTKAPITPTAPRKPDGIMTTQINKQTIIVELFWGHDSKETFGNKLMKIILAENITG